MLLFLGKFRRAAHSTCNLQYRINPDRVKIPVIIHNLKNYDSHLPEKEKFFSQLTDSHISDKDYQNALNVFNSLKMQSLQEYHDFYLVCDVLLLADVFEFSTYRAPYLLGCK